nr:hypothetical protein [Paraburkholderia fungorum]
MIGIGWTGSILGLLWLSASTAVGISEYSFRQLMAGPGYLLAEQLRPLSAAQREQRLIQLRQHFQYPVELVATDSVELSPQARTMLLHQQAAQTSDEEIAYFALDNDTLIQFGPMWGSAALADVLRSPVFLLTAVAASAPIVGFSLAAWRRKRQWCRDLQAITACLADMVRSPAVLLPAVDREWMPLMLAMRRHRRPVCDERASQGGVASGLARAAYPSRKNALCHDAAWQERGRGDPEPFARTTATGCRPPRIARTCEPAFRQTERCTGAHRP